MELQITQEYLGFATHLVYLAPLFEETLRADTYAKGPGSTVAKVVDGSAPRPRARPGMAGVANVGTDRNWCGSVVRLRQLVRLRPPRLGPRRSAPDAIADEWVRMTFAQRRRASSRR